MYKSLSFFAIFFSALAIAALLRHMKQTDIQIGVGGALVQFHPTYLFHLNEKLKVLAPKDVKVCGSWLSQCFD